MKVKQHIILFSIALVVWIGFYALGLPSEYYTKWRTAEKILLTIVTFFGVLPFIAASVLILMKEDYIKVSIWFAFYASIVIMILDVFTEKVIFGIEGNYFLIYWPQTLAYIYAWIIIPFVGLLLKRLTENIKNKVIAK